MANIERLTKRVKKVEKWIEENEEMATEDIAVKEDQLAQSSLDISHV